VGKSVAFSVKACFQNVWFLTFLKILGLVKLMRISRSAHTLAVPRIAPYPCGQGNLLPVTSVGQNPVVYLSDMRTCTTN
jgi:hypothetical protein